MLRFNKCKHYCSVSSKIRHTQGKYCGWEHDVEMTSPNIKVNTFFKEKKKTPFIDAQSKFFIIVESILGLNRTPLLFSKKRNLVVAISFGYCFLFKAALVYGTYRKKELFVPQFLCFIEYGFCCLFSLITWKRMERYYSGLNMFDNEIGCRPHLVAASMRNLCCMLVFSISVGVFYFLTDQFELSIDMNIMVMPMSLIHCLELFYYGQLLSLLIPRLGLINYYVESALSSGESVARPKLDEFGLFKEKHCKNREMSKLMDMYYIAIKAYDFLIDAIKWQLVVILITTFGVTLNFCYHVSLSIIRNENPFMDIMSDMGIIAVEMIPLFSPCLFGDRVHNEVRRLRELIASRLYENKLGKKTYE
ncbi:hypothetical protein evm_009556 [Chilo suppressalis]|nr:hypothetical protein evm_009556 [Chilo suppressalis]